jgi:hypothetical protein
MKNLIFILSILFLSCEKEKQESNTMRTKATYAIPNLIGNPGFEINCQSSFSGWQFVNWYATSDTFSTDVPSGGGCYSLKLQPGWFPAEGTAETYIAGLNCTGTFQLKFYAKCVNVVGQQTFAAIYMKTSPLPAMSVVYFSDPSWTMYTLNSMNYTLTPSDTLVVKLSAGSSEVANWEVLFDSVTLYKIP